MILVDTSVWVDHLRRRNSELARRLEEGEVLCHEFIVGELACGSLKNRKEILSLLQELPRAVKACHEEVVTFIDSRRLFGRGIGWIDAHLLASALLSRARLWTLDKRLKSLASDLGISSNGVRQIY